VELLHRWSSRRHSWHRPWSPDRPPEGCKATLDGSLTVQPRVDVLDGKIQFVVTGHARRSMADSQVAVARETAAGSHRA